MTSQVESGAPEAGRAIERLYRSHRAAVERVAFALVDGDADARDVAQAAFLKALQGAPRLRRAKSVRRYLLRIAVNEARELRRRRRFRADPLEGEPIGKGPAVAVEAARREFDRALVRALRTLPAKLREPLVLHYWEGLSFAEIGQVLGVSKSTVHTRCDRGVQRLRGALGPRWTAFALPLAASTKNALGVAAGGWLMTTKTLTLTVIAGALIVLGVLVPMLMKASDEETDADRAVTVPGGVASEAHGGPKKRAELPAGATPLAPIATEEFREQLPTPAATGPWVVKGRVRGSGGEVLRKVRVRARLYVGWWEENWSDRGSPTQEAELALDGEGRFSWPLPEPAGTVSVVVRAEGIGRLRTMRTRLVIEGEPAPQDIDLRLRPLDAELHGVVRDPQQRPIKGASVSWHGAAALTNDEGAYVVPVASALGSLDVSAAADGYGASFLVAKPAKSGGRSRLDFTLEPGGLVIVGTVRDEAGTPVPGVSIRSLERPPRRTQSDEAGRYQLEGLPRGERRLSVLTEHPGYVRKYVRTRVGEKAELTLDITVERGATVSGFVVDRGGRPVPGARIAIGQSFHALICLRAVSDREGRFEFTRVPEKRTRITVIAKGFAEKKQALDPSTREFSGMKLVLEPARQVAGRVTDGNGAPVPNIAVAARRDYRYLEARARTDADGNFVISELDRDPFTLELYGRGFVRHERPVTADESRVHIVMERHGALAGKVVDDLSGEPVPSFRVRLVSARREEGDRSATGYRSSLTSKGIQVSDPSGVWRIDKEEIPPGTVVGIEVWAEGYAPSIAERVVVTTAADPEALVLRLGRASSLAGEILRAGSRKPVRGARVRWFPAAHYDREVKVYPNDNRPDRARTDEGGRFEFRAVTPGRIYVEVRHDDLPPKIEGPFVVPSAGGVGRCTVLMDVGGTIRGVVRDWKGRPISGAKVGCSRVRAPGDMHAPVSEMTTGADGRFAREGLLPGRWNVHHVQRHGTTGIHVSSVRVSVNDGDVTEVDLAPKGKALLRIKLEAAGASGQGVTLHLLPWTSKGGKGKAARDGRTARAALVRDGIAIIEGLEGGTWHVAPLPTNFRPGAKRPAIVGSRYVEVGESGEFDATFTLEWK